MIEREFKFLLDAWKFCYQNKIPDWRERVNRKDWNTWRLTVPTGVFKATSKT